MIFSKLLKVFYPASHACISCGRKGVAREKNGNAVICNECIKSFIKTSEPTCIKCGRRLGIEESYCEMCAKHDFLFERAASVYVYDGEVKNVVRKLKYSGDAWLAEFAAEEMSRKYKELGWQCDYITFVPMYWTKERKRGYNQANVIAKKLAERCKIPCEPFLQRIKNTTPQSFLNKDERMKNVEDVFSFDKTYSETIKGKTVLVADDILTTGSSINECAKMLLNNGAAKVYGLCLCSVDGAERKD